MLVLKDAGEFFSQENFIILNNAIDTEKFIFNEESRNILEEIAYWKWLWNAADHIKIKFNWYFYKNKGKQKRKRKLNIIGDGPLGGWNKNYIKIII